MDPKSPLVLLVLALYGVLLLTAAVSAERRTRVLRDALGRLLARPAAEAALIAVFLFSAVYVGGSKPSAATNGTSAADTLSSGTTLFALAVSNQVTGALALLTYVQTLSGEGGVSVITQRLTAAQYAAGFALVSVRTNAAPWLSVPTNAVVHAPWTRYGVAEDTFYVPATNGDWSFAFGSNDVAGALVSSCGTLAFGRAKGSPRAAELPDGTDDGFLAPLQGSLGIVPPESRFWHAQTPSNSVLFTWENTFAGRDTNAPVTFQTELFANGDFAYRYAVPSNSSVAVSGSPFTNFVIGAQNNSGGETYALNDPAKLADGLELRWRAFGLLDPGTDDHDGDGISTYDEVMVYGTDPLSSDTDSDGMGDAWELANGLNPTDASDAAADPDGDGLSNLDESLLGSDPNAPDAGSEAAAGPALGGGAAGLLVLTPPAPGD